MRRALTSLRVRVALAAFGAVALILPIVGLLLIRGFESSERDALDTRLRARVEPAVRAAPQVLPLVPQAPADSVAGAQPPPPPRERGGFPGRGAFPAPPPPGLLRGSDDATRLIAGGQVVETLGDERASQLPLPARDGLRTVSGPDGRWRTLAVDAPGSPGTRVEVAASLAPLDARVARLRRRLLAMGAVGLAGAAAAGWLFGGAALRSLERLRRSAHGVSTTEDLSTRLPVGGGPDEVDELAATLNEMLARLQASNAETLGALEATRRFAADAGHELRTPLTSIGANIETMARNPALPADERASVVDALQSEQARAVALLDALQALARGDAGAVLPREKVDLGDVLDASIAAFRGRHPGFEISLTGLDDGVALHAWPQGIRLAIDNLLENAAIHGAPSVEVRVGVAGGSIEVTVDDGGPGVAGADREAIFERFRRGPDAAGAGSGVGLALVKQQAELHGGSIAVSDGPRGARFVLTLPKSG